MRYVARGVTVSALGRVEQPLQPASQHLGHARQPSGIEKADLQHVAAGPILYKETTEVNGNSLPVGGLAETPRPRRKWAAHYAARLSRYRAVLGQLDGA